MKSREYRQTMVQWSPGEAHLSVQSVCDPVSSEVGVLRSFQDKRQPQHKVLMTYCKDWEVHPVLSCVTMEIRMPCWGS